MKSGMVPSTSGTEVTPLLEAIRRKEGEVQRRLAAEAEAARAVLAAAEVEAREMVAAAEADGERLGSHQRQVAEAEADVQAKAIVAQARAEAEKLQRAGEQQMGAAVRLAVALVTEVYP
jgi:vacuolar-type H+-ATPase subunit H